MAGGPSDWAGGAGVSRVIHLTVAGVDTAVHQAGSGAPVVCVHGNPDSGAEWATLLTRAPELGRVLAPDLPGFGLSERPRPEKFGMTLDDYDRWFTALLDTLELERFRLVVHDWGGFAVAAASRRAEAVERLVIIDAVPMSSEYRWHWLARLWRTPVVGELMMAGFNRWTLGLLTRLSSPRPGPLPAPWLDEIATHVDAGMKRAILRLYRSADPQALGRAGSRLGELRCPTLLVWGEGDPYIGVEDGRRYARHFPNATFEVVPGAGHWCFREEPAVADRIVAFLRGAIG